MTGPEQAARTRATQRLVMVVAGGIAGVAIALAAVYGINTIQRNAGDTACAGAAALAQRLAPLAHGEVAAFAVADPPVRLPDLVFRDADGAERRSGGLARAHRAAQPLGHLVRALPQGDAGARCARGQARRAELPGGGDQHRHARSREGAHLAQGGRHRRARLSCRPQRQGVSGLEDGGSRRRDADHAARRSGRLRDRHGGGAGGMGERGCGEARERRAQAIALPIAVRISDPCGEHER